MCVDGKNLRCYYLESLELALHMTRVQAGQPDAEVVIEMKG